MIECFSRILAVIVVHVTGTVRRWVWSMWWWYLVFTYFKKSPAEGPLRMKLTLLKAEQKLQDFFILVQYFERVL